MAELITDEIFSDGQANIAASNMNGIVGRSRVQPDIIANKVASSTMNVADQMLVLKTDNTLARARFDTIVNSTSSALPIADSTKNGMLRQLSGKTTDFVDGTNNCQSIHALLPAGVVVDYAGVTIPPIGWLLCDGRSLLMTDYPDLYAAIGTTYGSVDATHFSIPDARGKVTAGAGGSFGALAATGGVATVALAVGNLPSHTHTMGSHTHTGAYHEHSMQNHTHGMDHAHGMDHQHTIGAGQFNHSHTYNGTVTPGGANLAAGTAFSPASGQTTSAWAQPQGVTLYASQTNAAWGNTLYASQTNGVWANTGGASVGNTAGPDRGLTTTGPSTNSTDATGSGTAFSILPPYLVIQKIIKV